MRLLSLSLFIFIGLQTAVLTAQVSPEVRQRRRELLEGVLRSLIEPQPKEQPLVRPDQPHVRPDTRPATRPDLRPIVQPAVITAEHKKIQSELEHFSTEINQLVGGLRKECVADARLRPILADLLKVKSNTDILEEVITRHHDFAYVSSQYPVIDRDWRILSHRLLQTPNLSASSRGFVGHINEHDENLLKLLRIKPQLNRPELTRLISALQTNLDHLQQDIFYELQGNPHQAKLIKQCQQIRVRTRQAIALIDRGNYDTIVASYTEAVSDWRPFAATLRKVSGERSRKNVVEIEQIAHAIHQQLWLPDKLDPAYLSELVSSADRDIDRVFTLITLADLMQVDFADKRIAAALQFKTASSQFVKSLEQQKPVKDLIWDFHAYERAWVALRKELSVFTQPQIKVALDLTADEIGLLKTKLGDGPGITQRELVEMAAQLDQLCSQMELVVRSQVKADNSYSGRFRQDFSKVADQLHDVAHHLHESIAARESREHITQDLEQTAQHWKISRRLLAETKGNHRLVLNQLRSQIDPLLVKMQLIYSE